MWSNRGTSGAGAGLPVAVGEPTGAATDVDAAADPDAVDAAADPDADDAGTDAVGGGLGRSRAAARRSPLPHPELANAAVSRTATAGIRAIIKVVSAARTADRVGVEGPDHRRDVVLAG
ncbi:MAG TPA: hypothetical protein VGX49_02220, partial [Jatrophihabitans sp.]|nr:hypothetical protein [Jatrophihabitans sp.]